MAGPGAVGGRRRVQADVGHPGGARCGVDVHRPRRPRGGAGHRRRPDAPGPPRPQHQGAPGRFVDGETVADVNGHGTALHRHRVRAVAAGQRASGATASPTAPTVYAGKVLSEPGVAGPTAGSSPASSGPIESMAARSCRCRSGRRTSARRAVPASVRGGRSQRALGARDADHRGGRATTAERPGLTLRRVSSRRRTARRSLAVAAVDRQLSGGDLLRPGGINPSVAGRSNVAGAGRGRAVRPAVGPAALPAR